VGVRDAQRRLRGAPPLPAGGRDLRARREGRPAQPQAARLHAVEHGRGQPERRGGVHRRPGAGRPARGSHEHGVRPVLRLHPLLPPPRARVRRDGGVLRGQTATGRRTTSRRRTSTRSASRAASTRSTSSPGRRCRTSSPPTRG
jgi:hypothetical protein